MNGLKKTLILDPEFEEKKIGDLTVSQFRGLMKSIAQQEMIDGAERELARKQSDYVNKIGIQYRGF